MEGLQLFQGMGFRIRTVVKDGEPWFVAKDVCESINIIDVHRAISRLDEDESFIVKGKEALRSLTPEPNISQMYIISESGLYNLIIRSDKQEAKAFRKWITSEVLPSIRKTGKYEVSAKPDSYMIEDARARCERWLEEYEEKRQLQLTVIEQKPKVDKYDMLINADNYISLGDAAKSLGIGRNAFISSLKKAKILMENRVPYQTFIDRGYFVVKQVPVLFGTKTKMIPTTYATSRGINWLSDRIRKSNRGEAG